MGLCWGDESIAARLGDGVRAALPAGGGAWAAHGGLPAVPLRVGAVPHLQFRFKFRLACIFNALRSDVA